MRRMRAIVSPVVTPVVALAVTVAVALVATACSGGSETAQPSTTRGTSGASTPTTGASPGGSDEFPEVPVPVLEWTDCGENLQCTTMPAPLDYRRPVETAGGAQISVVRHLALSSKKRIGSLLVNPGGPGFGGTDLALAARAVYGSDLLQAFDIVGFDPRGTGGSLPAVDCITDYDAYFAVDSDIDTPEGLEAALASAAEFESKCETAMGASLDFITTEDTARDMDLLRRALGEETISYLGFSYGSELGAAWASMFPATVRAAVLDGAVDPNASAMENVVNQARGFEHTLDSFLEYCRDSCSFPAGGDPGAKFDEIFDAIEKNRYPTVEGRPRLSLTIAYSAVFKALYSTRDWERLDAALVAAAQGDGRLLLELHDDYFQRRADGTYPNDLEAFTAITCIEDGGPYTVAEVTEYDDEIIAAAPRLYPGFLGSIGCIPWADHARTPSTVTGTDAATILVIGTTNDPATPLESTRKMAEALKRSVLLTVDDDGHTAYVRNSCTRKVVGAYLIKLELPDEGKVCD